MDTFFQVIKELPTNQNHWTAVGIDGMLAGQKAVMREGTILYQTEGLPAEVQELLKSRQPKPGLLETPYGRLFTEILGTGKKLILCGGGHVSAATLSIAKMLEFHITVLEDRPEFARAAEMAGADRVVCADFSQGMASVETDSDTYVVVMTRGHRHDLDCLHQVLKKDYAYLGMMGSRSRVKKVKEQLLAEGYDAEKIQGLHAPIGLPISAVTPAEIAVSVMAEVIQEKNRNRRQEAYEQEVAEWLFGEKNVTKKSSVVDGTEKEAFENGIFRQERNVVLATIIARKGSAPRQVGTKMLIFPDGSSIGTIGGGCMEAEVKSRARHMLAAYEEACRFGDFREKEKELRYRTCFVDMTALDAEEEGMVCGGTLEIFLEVL